MHSLPIFLRLKDRPVIVAGSGAAFEARRRLVERAGGIPAEEDANAAVAFVAHEDLGEAAAAAARLRARGVLVNVADRPELCDFTMPALVDRDPVIIAIGTGGASAGLAAELRQRLEGLIPAGIGALAAALREARAQLRERFPDGAASRRALMNALEPGGDLDPMHATPADVEAWLQNPERQRTGRVETICLVSPDPDDLTLRQARLLAAADRLAHTPDVPESILIRARADAARVEAHDLPAPPAEGLTVFVRRA